MPFLTLNGYTVRVADKTPRRRPHFRGSKTRSYGGQAKDGTRGVRRQWQMRACFEDHEDAQTLIGIVNGYGHVAFFRNGFEGQRTGLSPEVGSLAGVRFDRTLGPFGSSFELGSLRLDTDAVALRYHAQLPDEWTLLWWQTESNVGTWHALAKRSDGAAWLDGSQDDTLWPSYQGNIALNVKGGSLEISGFGADEVAVHHLAILPYLASSAAIESAWHGSQTTPWGPLPALRMEGDLLLTDHEFVYGEVNGVQYKQVGSRDTDFGRILNNSEIVEFTLTEIATGFVADATVPGP